jgi:hypothetical protein
MDQISVAVLKADGLAQLLQRPDSRRVTRKVEMQQPARAMVDDDKDREQPKRHGGRDEEVAGNDRPGVVSQKGRPALIATGLPAGRFGMYFPTVRAETRSPSFSRNSLAMRSTSTS